jgi:hypothetical protein
MAADTQQADIDRLHELIRSTLPDLPADEGALRGLLEEAGRLPAPGAV